MWPAMEAIVHSGQRYLSDNHRLSAGVKFSPPVQFPHTISIIHPISAETSRLVMRDVDTVRSLSQLKYSKATANTFAHAAVLCGFCPSILWHIPHITHITRQPNEYSTQPYRCTADAKWKMQKPPTQLARVWLCLCDCPMSNEMRCVTCYKVAVTSVHTHKCLKYIGFIGLRRFQFRNRNENNVMNWAFFSFAYSFSFPRSVRVLLVNSKIWNRSHALKCLIGRRSCDVGPT